METKRLFGGPRDAATYRTMPIRAGAVETAAPRPAVMTVPNVPILETGSYHLSTGEVTFTDDDLADAVAAQDDPAVPAPRIKIGHTDPRFNGDGSPALGVVSAMRLSENGQTIYADLVGVPTWLADVMPFAYPGRSIEGDMNVEVGFEGRLGAESATGRKYRLVLSALALLGDTLPGVATLDDLPLLFAGDLEAPEAEPAAQGGVGAGVTFEAVKVKAAKSAPQLAASVNVEDVRRAYYDAIEGDPESYSYWIRAIYIEPNELIVDRGEGDNDLLRIPFEAGDDGIEFGESSQVRVEYVAAQGTIAAAQGRKAVTYTDREQARASAATEEASAMTREELCSKFGLDPETATDAQIEAAKTLAEAGSEGETPPAETPAPDPTDPAQPAPDPAVSPGEAAPANEPGETPPTPTDPPAEPAEQTATPEPVAASGTVTVDAETFEALKRGAAAGEAARQEQVTVAREALLASAVEDGRIPPARVDHYRKAHKADPTGTEQLLASLEKGTVPVGMREVGESPAPGDVAGAGTDYPAEWFPDAVANRRAVEAAAAGAAPTTPEFVTKEA